MLKLQTTLQAPESEFLAFMAVIRHDQVDYIVDTLLEYDSVTEYLVSMETTHTAHSDTSGQHFHFLARMSHTHYKNYADRVFRKKYHLRGQAIKGHPRQYGKLREIHDFEQMATYTCKDGNIRTNMDQEIVKRWVENSFKKDDEKVFREQIYDFLDCLAAPEFMDHEQSYKFNKLNEDNFKDTDFLKVSILAYFREKCSKIPNANVIRSYITGYMLYHRPKEYSLVYVSFWLFGNR